MSSIGFLPSQDRWIDDLCERLLAGERLVVHAPPRMGKSYLAEAVALRLGGTALFVAGGAFTETNQRQLREQLRDSILDSVDTHGNAQLIFDDYHLALRRTQGMRLQANLVSLLIDGDQARDIGAVFFARYSTPVHLPGRGSPLMSRCSLVSMPRWDANDLSGSGLNVRAVNLGIGDSASFLAVAQAEESLEIGSLTRRLSVDAESVLNDLPIGAVLTLAGRESPALNDFDRRSLDGLWREGVGLTGVARGAQLDVLAAQRNAGWPSGLDASAHHFARLLDGRESAIWCDRYVFKSVGVLAQFISRVRRYSPVRLQILGTERPGEVNVSPAQIRAAFGALPDVEGRIMLPTDRRQLHDRHLALRGEPGGWVLPTADVITGAVDAGSAIATRAAVFGVDYTQAWERSRHV